MHKNPAHRRGPWLTGFARRLPPKIDLSGASTKNMGMDDRSTSPLATAFPGVRPTSIY